VTVGKATRLTWTRVAIALSMGLVVFGVVDASLPHSIPPGAITPNYSVPRLGPQARPNAHVGTARSKSGTAMPLRSVPLKSQADATAQSVAERFVVATDTTDPTHPEGNAAERALLTPGLSVPRQLAWPEAWVAECRRTTVVLDPPGPAVEVGGDQGGAGGRAGHAASDHATAHRNEKKCPALGGHQCRDRLVNDNLRCRDERRLKLNTVLS
jgi:hypothetical protein